MLLSTIVRTDVFVHLYLLFYYWNGVFLQVINYRNIWPQICYSYNLDLWDHVTFNFLWEFSVDGHSVDTVSHWPKFVGFGSVWGGGTADSVGFGLLPVLWSLDVTIENQFNLHWIKLTTHYCLCAWKTKKNSERLKFKHMWLVKNERSNSYCTPSTTGSTTLRKGPTKICDTRRCKLTQMNSARSK